MTSVIRNFISHPLLLTAEGGELVWCNWCEGPVKDIYMGEASSSVENEILDMAVKQLEEYFAGTRSVFPVPFRMEGTDFQKRVWTELLKIPYGGTITYKELAHRIGKPGACRAVANACGANHVDVIIPCHRVVASGGRIGGYTGGTDIKMALLDIEQRSAPSCD